LFFFFDHMYLIKHYLLRGTTISPHPHAKNKFKTDSVGPDRQIYSQPLCLRVWIATHIRPNWVSFIPVLSLRRGTSPAPETLCFISSLHKTIYNYYILTSTFHLLLGPFSGWYYYYKNGYKWLAASPSLYKN